MGSEIVLLIEAKIICIANHIKIFRFKLSLAKACQAKRLGFDA